MLLGMCGGLTEDKLLGGPSGHAISPRIAWCSHHSVSR
jgi:hypothetical protein